MANANFVGSGSFFRNVFDGTFMNGINYNGNCVQTRLRELAREASNMITKICGDVQKNERTLKFLDEKNIGVLEEYAKKLDEFVSFCGINASPSASTVKYSIKKAMPSKRFGVDMLEKATKRIKSGLPIEVVATDSLKNGMSSYKKEFFAALTDYKYYKDHSSGSNKNSSGYVLGSEGYVKDYAARVFGSSYTRSRSYSDIMGGHVAWIKGDLKKIADSIASLAKKAGDDADIDRLKQYSKQSTHYFSHVGMVYVLKEMGMDVELPQKSRPHNSVDIGPASSPINWASEDDQRKYVWDKMHELFVDNEEEGKKLTEWQIAAIMGSMAYESHFSPSNASDSAKEGAYKGADNKWSESSNKYLFRADDSIAFGLIQWTNSNRKAALEKFTKDKAREKGYDVYTDYLYDMDTQLEFLYHELNEKTINKNNDLTDDYPKAFSKFVSATNKILNEGVKDYAEYVRQCAENFSKLIVSEHHADIRGDYAIIVLMLYGSDDAKRKLEEALGYDVYENFIEKHPNFFQTR